MPAVYYSPDASPAGAGGPSDRRVLLVEDCPAGRQTLRILLELWGFAVEVAEDGRQGVHKALAWRPHAAIIDIGLPILSGYEVASQLRAALQDHVTLIALTAYCSAEDRRRAFAAGFDFHMAKPADLEALRLLLAGSKEGPGGP